MSNSGNRSIMQIRDVYKTYVMGEVEVRVLRGIDLDVHAQELLVILGESGSGKSTLMNLIGGIDTASSGSLVFEGSDLSNLSERALTNYRRTAVGFVFQFYNLVPTLTALENVNVAAEVADHPLDPAETLRLVGLGDRTDHFPAQLSGGEQQRVAIARALVGRPRLLLCDEPTGALDHETSIVVLDLLQHLCRETGTTVVLITHARPISGLADRTIFLVDGKVARIDRNATPQAAKDLAW
jgi:putative ABC transport system ATP-binding protein